MNKYIKNYGKDNIRFSARNPANRGDGAWYYRWGIEQVQVEEETKYKCHEVLVWETITADKITRAVVDYLWGNGLEQNF